MRVSRSLRFFVFIRKQFRWLIAKTFRYVTLFYLAFFILIVLFSSWVTGLIYEPQLDLALNNRILIFLSTFIPTGTVTIIIIALVRLVMGVLLQRRGAVFRLQLTVLFIVLIIIPMAATTVFSISFISTNIELLFRKEATDALEQSVEKMRLAHIARQETMSYTLRRAERALSLADVFQTEDNPHVSPYHAGLRTMRNQYGISNYFILDRKQNVLASFHGDAFSLRTFLTLKRDVFSETDAVLDYTYQGKHYIVAIRSVRPRGVSLGHVLWFESIPPAFFKKRNRMIQSLRTYKALGALRAEFEGIATAVYIFFSAVVTLFAIGVAFLFSRSLSLPISELIEGTRRIARDDLGYRLRPRGNSEMRFLIRRFNNMAKDLKHHRDLVARTERVEAWREVALRLAHEIKNPLTPINLNAEMIPRLLAKPKRGYKEKVRAAVNVILAQSNTIMGLVRDFSQFSFTTEKSDEPSSLVAALEEAVASFVTPDSRVTVTLTLAKEDFLIPMDARKLQMAFMNLIKNAYEAIEGKGAITIASAIKHDSFGEAYLVTVEDTGAGIPDSQLISIFEPYFTTKAKGSGLGLSVVEKIINDHNGYIYVESELGKGTVFFIEFRRL